MQVFLGVNDMDKLKLKLLPKMPLGKDLFEGKSQENIAKIISENIKYFLNLPLKSGMDLKYLLPALSLRKTEYFWFEQK